MASKKKPMKKQPEEPVTTQEPVPVDEPVAQEPEGEPVEPETAAAAENPESSPKAEPEPESPQEPVIPTEPKEPESTQEPVPEVTPQAESTQESQESPELTPVHRTPFAPSVRDPRLPEVGSVIQRTYKGRNYTVTVLEDGFEYEGQRYGSLSKVAKLITNQSVNGFVWWQLGYKDGRRPSTGRSVAERKITKIEKLTARMRAALEEGQQAVADAEKELASLQDKAEQLAPKAE